MGSCFSACGVKRRRRSGQPKAARGDQDLLCGVGTQDAGGPSAGLGGQSASACILDAETAQVMMHMTSAAASDCCHGHVFTSSASAAACDGACGGCPPACLAGTGSNSEHISLNSEAPGLLPDRAVKMRTHERAANLALAGLILAPLFISVNPNLNVILTACLTVYVGCYRSVKATPPPKTMSKEHAMRYPLVRSVMLLSLFLLLKFVSKDLVNTFLRSCFFVPDIAALYATLLPLVDCFLPQGWNDNAIIWRAPCFHSLSVEFTKSQAVASISGFFICVWSAMKKHWLANNVLGIAYCIQRIEMLSLGSFKTGGIFLAGHFVYDVFWVFFTPVMTTVAKSVDASIKLRFPTADDARTFFILGLGDIVIPGKFVALALRFDVSRGIKNRYFGSAFLGYAAGITATLAVRNWFQAAQPALLYIVPGVAGFVAAHSLWNGEAKPLLEFEEKAGKGDGKDPKQSKKVD